MFQLITIYSFISTVFNILSDDYHHWPCMGSAMPIKQNLVYAKAII